jgi:hypothetical protein
MVEFQIAVARGILNGKSVSALSNGLRSSGACFIGGAERIATKVRPA